jgi:hypothetical protein
MNRERAFRLAWPLVRRTTSVSLGRLSDDDAGQSVRAVPSHEGAISKGAVAASEGEEPWHPRRGSRHPRQVTLIYATEVDEVVSSLRECPERGLTRCGYYLP